MRFYELVICGSIVRLQVAESDSTLMLKKFDKIFSITLFKAKKRCFLGAGAVLNVKW